MKKQNFRQGFYVPKNPEKYRHSIFSLTENEGLKNRIKYRSSWELKFFVWCDTNENVKWWSSEPFGIDYFNPISEKKAKYYPDVFLEYYDQKYLIEIKPQKEIYNPKNAYDMMAKIVNEAKFEAAKKYCDSNDIRFALLTDITLFK